MSPQDPQPEDPNAGNPQTPPPTPPPPAGGYPPPAGPSLPTPTMEGFPPARQSDETIWALLAHLSYFVLALIGPLIIMLVAGDQRPYAKAHAIEALNFHITVLIGVVISIVLIFVIIGFFTLFAVIIAGIVFTIMAAIQAGQGEGYRYPINIRMVK
jgi:uncharacterized protein